MSRDAFLSDNSQGIMEIQQKASEVLAKYMNRKDIKLTGAETKTELRFDPGGVMQQRGRLHARYNELLRGKVSDPYLIKQTIHFAELLIQPNSFTTIEFVSCAPRIHSAPLGVRIKREE